MCYKCGTNFSNTQFLVEICKLVESSYKKMRTKIKPVNCVLVFRIGFYFEVNVSNQFSYHTVNWCIEWWWWQQQHMSVICIGTQDKHTQRISLYACLCAVVTSTPCTMLLNTKIFIYSLEYTQELKYSQKYVKSKYDHLPFQNDTKKLFFTILNNIIFNWI